jgi:hypothetical protein
MTSNFDNLSKVAAFLAKFRDVPDTDCRVWSRPFAQGTQPQVWWDGAPLLIRRVAWQIAQGAPAVGMEVRSSCGVSACAAPAHLFLSTTAERCAGTQAAHKAIPVARYAQRARLSDADTAIIKGMVAGGRRSPISRLVLADLYDCSPMTITRLWAEARQEERAKAVYLVQDAERTAREAAEAPGGPVGKSPRMSKPHRRPSGG